MAHKQMILLLTYHQVSSSLMYATVPRYVSISSSHIITRGVPIVQ